MDTAEAPTPPNAAPPPESPAISPTAPPPADLPAQAYGEQIPEGSDLLKRPEVRMHIVGGKAKNLRVFVLDEPGPGGANHRYAIADITNDKTTVLAIVAHQKGALAETGVNGIHNENLLAIVAHRLAGFQAGPFHCRENQEALDHTLTALAALKRRTQERIDRGVEGQSKQ